MVRKTLTLVALIVMMAISPVSFAQDPSIIRIGLGDPIDSEMGAIATRFKEIVESRTDGNVEIRIYPNGQLGDETEMIQDVRRGNLDMAVIGIANLVPIVNKLGLLTLPYLFDNMYEVVRGSSGPAHDMLNEFAVKEGGFRILGWTYTGYRYLSNAVHPIKTLADIKDMKFRVPKSAVIIETYRSWGAIPVPIPWADTYIALQLGAVDGQCYGYITFQAAAFDEVQKFITEAHYTYQLQPMIISERIFKKFSPEMQEIFVEAGRYAQQYCLAFQLMNATRVKAELIASGIQIDNLEDEKEWKRLAIENVWPKVTNFIGGQKVLDRYLGYIGKK
ncbi:TRAP transporter substrate-binding protein [Halodesulfovibrio marinisediminis]|uniref:Tripartite ATP-independent transporter solute receptor, DctP family n=1 Tax=Halodesulfovibrio marinisediminis DSM 17456 TaxID=1121457 RepID=A0A1N6FLW8_9BACT|nr:TRAP transporter substrate-binding protein [Halodesulfovibrio marinisediminis]SIN96258.1 tripartite ATP-independent transporter solute receptor, DctP family [Halodesulfovibrio marinisediminis DSM 17456]